MFVTLPLRGLGGTAKGICGFIERPGNFIKIAELDKRLDIVRREARDLGPALLRAFVIECQTFDFGALLQERDETTR
jgi:hypothetical protein